MGIVSSFFSNFHNQETDIEELNKKNRIREHEEEETRTYRRNNKILICKNYYSHAGFPSEREREGGLQGHWIEL